MMKSVELKAITQRLIDFDPASMDEGADDLISLAIAMSAQRLVLVAKIPKALLTASDRDPDDYFPHLLLAKYYAFERPDKAKSMEYASSAESKMIAGDVDRAHPHFSDLSLVSEHWTSEKAGRKE